MDEVRKPRIAGTRQAPPQRFATPTIANGKVYIGATSEVDVYGLLPLVSPTGVKLGPGQTQQFTVNTQNLASQTVTWAIISVTPTGSAQGRKLFEQHARRLYIAPVRISLFPKQ